jgi:hypothetical protein
MSAFAVALVAASGLAAGTVVDLVARGELRTSLLSEPVADGFSNQLTVGGVTPQLRVAHQGQMLFLDANYAPNLSVIHPSADYFLVMHRFGGQASYAPSSRLRFTADLTGAIGDVDAGAAVRDLGNSRVSALVGGGSFAQFPFGDVTAGLSAGYRIAPRLTFNGAVRTNVTGSPSPGDAEQVLLPFQVRPETNGSLTWLLTPTDSITGDLQFRSAILADRRGILGNGGGYAGFTPSLAYNRSLFPGVVGSARAGWLTAVVDEGKGRDLLLHGLPLLDGALRASVNLSGEGAIEGALVGGVTPSSDPLGGLLEERVGAGVQGAWRVNRNLTFTTAVSSFATLYAIGGNAVIAQESSTAVGGSVGMAYNLTEWVSLTAEGLGTARVISDKFGRLVELRPDVTFSVGITGAMNLFRMGERPPGTDPRPGRAVATRPVSLPGTSRAFSGRAERTPARRALTRAQIEAMDDDELLDADDALDRSRRGVGDDVRREVLARQAAKKKAIATKKPGEVDALKSLDDKAKAAALQAKAKELEAEQARKKKKKKDAAVEVKKPKP